MREGVRRALSVVLVATVASSAVLGGFAPLSQNADAVEIATTTEERALATGVLGGTLGTSGIGLVFDNTVNTDAIIENEVEETKNNALSAVATQNQNNDILLTSYRNYLEDTQSIGTLIATNEYVRQLNNESSEATARNEAKQAYKDYYSTKEIQLINQWNVTVERIKTIKTKIDSDPNISSDVYYPSMTLSGDGASSKENYQRSLSFETYTYTLANGSTKKVQAIRTTFQADDVTSGETYTTEILAHPFQTSWSDSLGSLSSSNYNVEYNAAFKVKSTSVSPSEELLRKTDWNYIRESITNQTTALDQRMDDIVNSTYADYQAGQINSSDLLNPLSLTREYSPDGEYGTYTLSLLTSQGYAAPDSLSSTKAFNVTVNGNEEYQGVLLVDNPPSGGINVSETYNTSNLEGAEYIQTNRSLVEIPDASTFTVTSVLDTDGNEKNVSTISYTDPEYETNDLSEFNQTMQELREFSAELNARQANLSSGGGGGPLLGGVVPDLGLGLSSGQKTLLLIGGVAVFLILISRD